MSFADLPTLAEDPRRVRQKWDEPSATTDRHLRKLTRQQRLAAAYADVDRRDAGVCWVTGRRTGGSSSAHRREHHHLAGRNVRPEWKYDPDHIIVVCGDAHSLITSGKIDVEGDDAQLPIFFHWNCKPSERLFEILPVRLRAVIRDQAVCEAEERE